MLERGEGYLLTTASAAGLLTQIGSAPYAVTKHMAVAFAEWLSMTYGDRGIKVSCLCPQGVKTGMLNESSGPAFLLVGAIEADAVAGAVVEGLREECFLILPHREVKQYVERKASDPEPLAPRHASAPAAHRRSSGNHLDERVSRLDVGGALRFRRQFPPLFATPPRR